MSPIESKIEAEKKGSNLGGPAQAAVNSWLTLVVLLVIWCGAVALSSATYAPLMPVAQSRNTIERGEEAFSVEQAKSYLQQLVGDSIPHPLGTKQNAIVRERVVSILRSQGYDVSTQVGTVDVADWSKSRTKFDQLELHNIIAVKKGRSDGKAIALVTHFDSVAAGPGASDDGVGLAAALEIARLYSAMDKPRRDIVFLVTDGEEFGLLGAKMFAKKHPLMDEIGLVINLEARGTSGASLMFETSPMSRYLVPLYARSAAKPVSSSLFREVYKRMPNNTDFSVFDQHGKLGFNFAFIGDVRNYHTPADNFENVDEGSLNHHGQNALSLLKEIQQADHLDELIDGARESWGLGAPEHEAVYFDFFGWFLVWWPQSWSLSLTFGAALCFVAASVVVRPTEDQSRPTVVVSARSVAFLVCLYVLLLIATIGVGWGFQILMRMDPQLSHPWPRSPMPILVSFWSLGLAIIGGCACLLGHGFNSINNWWSLGIYWLGLAAMVSYLIPGASYLFVVPILLASVFALVSRLFTLDPQIWIAVLASVAGVMWLPMERLFFDAVGLTMPYAEFFRIAIVATTLMGCMGVMSPKVRFAFTMTMVVVTVLAVLFALLSK